MEKLSRLVNFLRSVGSNGHTRRQVIPSSKAVRKVGAVARLSLESLEGRQLLCACGCPPGMTMTPDMDAICDIMTSVTVTNEAVRTGNWSSPTTWQNGHVPGNNANVVIPKGLTVTVDGIERPLLHTLNVAGTLQFAPDQDTALNVDTMLVGFGGTLDIGTAATPIDSNRHAVLTFTDTAPINTTWDPHEISRGLISMGTVNMAGAPTTPYETLTRAPMAGDTTLYLASVPINWHVGDELVVANTDWRHTGRDDEVHIRAISGTRVTVSPLIYDHAVPATGLNVYVADLTRNVMIVSQKPADIAGRGHVMFMTQTVNINSVAFCDLGRTNKSIPLNNPKLDANGRLIPGTGTNTVGRYAIHFHHTGTSAAVAPAVVNDSVVDGSPGWGYVNHDSYVNFTGDVAYNVTGAAFVTESGSEIGSFQGDLSIRTLGEGTGLKPARPVSLQDFGFDGDGFYLKGGGVSVNNDIAADANMGFLYYAHGLINPGGTVTQFAAANLANPALAHGKTYVSVESVPIRSFSHNVAFDCFFGLRIEYMKPLPGARNIIDSFTGWDLYKGISIGYSTHETISQAYLVSGWVGANEGPEAVADIRYQNVNIQGFSQGISVSQQGSGHVIVGGYFNNVINIFVGSALSLGRNVSISGAITFGTMSRSQLAALGATKQYDIWLDYNVPWLMRFYGPQGLLNFSQVIYQGQQIYAVEQSANYVPFPSGSTPPNVAAQVVGLTNQQLWDRYGLAMGGVIAPSNTTTSPRIQGLLGSPTNPSLPRLASLQRANVRELYQLRYRTARGALVIDPQPVHLKRGWNLLTRLINGHEHSFWVDGV
jgi:hypothetical protein